MTSLDFQCSDVYRVSAVQEFQSGSAIEPIKPYNYNEAPQEQICLQG